MAAVDLEFLTVLIREIQIFKRLCTASLGCGPPLHVALNCWCRHPRILFVVEWQYSLRGQCYCC